VGIAAGWTPGSFFFFTFPFGLVEAATLAESISDGGVAGGLLAGRSQPAARAAAIETMRQRATMRMDVSSG